MGEPARNRREQGFSALDALVDGRRQVLEVVGEAGIGKTRLLAELTDLADSRGVRVRFPRSSRQFNDRITDRRPTVLLVDDAHEVRVLDEVLRTPPVDPVLLVVAHRADHAWLPAALARTPWPVTRVALGPPDPAAVLPDLPPAERARLVAVTGGNPRYLRALAGVDPAVVDTLSDPRRIGEAPLPDGVLAVAGQGLRGLDGVPREVAYAVAAADDPADLGLVAHIAGLPEPDVLRALDDLTVCGLVSARGSRVAFRHPLVRAAAYQAAGFAWRARAHRRAWEYLRTRDAPLPLRALHAARIAGYGDTEPARTLAAGAAAVVDTAPATAAAWLDRAVEVLPRAESLPLLGRALSLSGELARARDVLHEALVHSGPDRVVAVRACARTARLLGRYAEAKAVLDRESTAGLAAERATVALLLGDTTECARLARAAVAEGDEVAGRILGALGAVRSGEPPDLSAEVRLVDGLSGGVPGQGTTGPPAAASSTAGPDGGWAERSDTAGSANPGAVPPVAADVAGTVRLVDGLPDAAVGDHLSALAWLELELDRPLEAARHLRRGLAFARATGRRSTLPTLLSADAAVAVRLGQLDRARECAAEAREVALALGSAELAAMASAVELEAVLWQAGPEEALAAVPEPASPWLVERVGLTVADCHLAAGEYERCADHVRAAVGEDFAGASGRERPRWRAALAVALAGLDRCDEAMALADAAVAAAPRSAYAHLARAQVLGRLGRADEARAEAVAALRAGPLDQARARELLAEHLATEGELTAARAELGRAKEGYAATAATWLTTRLRTTETRVGARAPRPRRPHGTVEALSGRELEIAELVATGLTNREVATRLVLSRKTVEGHLARVFTKLGVKSRLGVAQRLAARST
ncbi:LuxR C-terminal-related transcriptional regulator [Actinokineospora auranticolor]|uniref:Regulatory LuxR family protein n=1 Tax=Actinokineospora auranticolor TaxID=155976 RepID=A0A2S6GT66_9PSEU|nr:LuxR family transcriptional regulator [Actinokineospora auranticolor]PPK68386.1 regulatory LuxR family protein [Actinokineospora auranticolor]